jgi:CheY-like chemotaxis protein
MASVLIVERDVDLRRLYSAVIRGLGHEPAFIEKKGTVPPADVLLVEPAQPECMEIARRLRERQPSLPIVCASSRPIDVASDPLEPTVYLVKPFSLVQLTDSLEAALGHPGPGTDG